MQRWIAKLLLLIALAGNVAPFALAATYSQAHACCLRKGSHHCHEANDGDSPQLAFRDVSCCNGNCLRAVTTTRWAHPQPRTNVFYVLNVRDRVTRADVTSSHAEIGGFRPSRAPPSC
jgi:hypothetical protein